MLRKRSSGEGGEKTPIVRKGLSKPNIRETVRAGSQREAFPVHNLKKKKKSAAPAEEKARQLRKGREIEAADRGKRSLASEGSVRGTD